MVEWKILFGVIGAVQKREALQKYLEFREICWTLLSQKLARICAEVESTQPSGKSCKELKRGHQPIIKRKSKGINSVTDGIYYNRVSRRSYKRNLVINYYLSNNEYFWNFWKVEGSNRNKWENKCPHIFRTPHPIEIRWGVAQPKGISRSHRDLFQLA